MRGYAAFVREVRECQHSGQPLEDARAMFAEGDSLEKIARITKIPQEILEANLFIKM